jgi:cellobiose phosphorylase
MRSKSRMHVVTEVDPKSNAVFARNRYNADFSARVGFVDCSETQRRITGDRTEFLGRNGTAMSPAAMYRARLSGRVGAGLDPCAAMQVPVELADGQEKEIVFVVGAGRDQDDARVLVQRFRSVAGAREALEKVWNYWNRTLGVVYVETEDPAVNVLANGWLLYQDLSCRMWGRTGFYQSGGAYGFRDQLQDSMALLHAEPKLVREHLLRSAAHQFKEGDVQHWWHPPTGRGCARAFLTTIFGCPTPRVGTCAGSGTRACWMRRCRSSRVVRCARMRNRTTTFRGHRRKSARCTNTASGPSSMG